MEGAEWRRKCLFVSQSVCNSSFLTLLLHYWLDSQRCLPFLQRLRRAHLPKVLVLSFSYWQVAGGLPLYLQFHIDFTCEQVVKIFNGASFPCLLHPPVLDLLEPYKTCLGRNLKNAGQNKDHFLSFLWFSTVDQAPVTALAAWPARDSHRIPACLLSKGSTNPFENKGLLITYQSIPAGIIERSSDRSRGC